MVALIKNWFQRRFSDPEAMGLLLLIMMILTVMFIIGGLMAPVITSVIIAYLLSGMVSFLDRYKIPHTVSTSIVYSLFIGVLYLGLLVLLPIIWDQVRALALELPNVLNLGNQYVIKLNQRYPDYVSIDQIQQILISFKSELASLGQYVVAISLSSLGNLVSVVIYLVLVPLLVFFMLRDETMIVTWLEQFIPQQRRLISQVWDEVNSQIGNFIRAKVLEIFLVSVVSVLAFVILGLKYSVLLGVLVGLSTLIPFVGVTVVTVPIVLVAYLQWGWSADFAYLVIVYGIIAVIDGNILAPVLFSEAVKLHPIAVIISILFFGGIWGFWGVFFAIPLATLVKAIFNAWPRDSRKSGVAS